MSDPSTPVAAMSDEEIMKYAQSALECLNHDWRREYLAGFMRRSAARPAQTDLLRRIDTWLRARATDPYASVAEAEGLLDEASNVLSARPAQEDAAPKLRALIDLMCANCGVGYDRIPADFRDNIVAAIVCRFYPTQEAPSPNVAGLIARLNDRAKSMRDTMAGRGDEIANELIEAAFAIERLSKPPETVVVEPEEFARIQEDLANPKPPTQAVLEGAELLRSLSKPPGDVAGLIERLREQARKTYGAAGLPTFGLRLEDQLEWEAATALAALSREAQADAANAIEAYRRFTKQRRQTKIAERQLSEAKEEIGRLRDAVLEEAAEVADDWGYRHIYRELDETIEHRSEQITAASFIGAAIRKLKGARTSAPPATED